MAEVTERPHVSIIGLGGIGGLLAGLLVRAGYRVTGVIRWGAVRRSDKTKLRIDSRHYGDFVVELDVSTTIPPDSDLVIVAVKYPDLADVTKQTLVRYAGNGFVLPLMNGIGIVDELRSNLQTACLAGSIGFVEAFKAGDGCVEHRSSRKPLVELASDGDAEAHVSLARACLSDAGIDVNALDSEAEVVWRKLARLDAISSMTAAYQNSVGALRINRQTRGELVELVDEAVAVAAQEGVFLSGEQVLNSIDQLPFDLTTSLQRDVMAGRPSEIDVITGGVIRRAETYDLGVPMHRRIYQQIRRRMRERWNACAMCAEESAV